jgi:L-ascorbate metabolism protein UlaG (beta-lactamase superfamily)
MQQLCSRSINLIAPQDIKAGTTHHHHSSATTPRHLSRRAFGAMALQATAGVVLMGSLPIQAHAKNSSLLATKIPLPKLPQPHEQYSTEISIQWIGHSTMLIQAMGVCILTDPVMFERIGLNLFGATIGPKRLVQPAVALALLPKPDLILLSHAHIDHTDLNTLEYFAETYPAQIDVITAKNTIDITEHLLWRSVQELDWGMSYQCKHVTITALEVLHNGWRMPWEADRRNGQKKIGRSYNGYLIECANKRLVFGGDTTLTEAFRTVSNVDVAMMPIGAYTGCFDNHCTPEEALAMADMMQAKAFMPMHCNTFGQVGEPMKEPMQRLMNARAHHATEIVTHSIGQIYRLNGEPIIAHATH